MSKHKELVLVYHKEAIAFNRGTKSGGNYFEIRDGETVLGQGKSEQNAWTAAYRNVYDHR
jgi:hypothetical protein